MAETTMDPHIVRSVDKKLLEKAIALYQKNYSEITEEDWNLIIRFRDLVKLSTMHLYPKIIEPASFLQLTDLNSDIITEYSNKYNMDFQKRYQLYLRGLTIEKNIYKKNEIIKLLARIEHDQWDVILSEDLSKDISNSIHSLFWIKLFQNIDFNDNWINRIDEKFNNLIEKIINNVFKHNEEKKKECIDKLQTNNYDSIIGELTRYKHDYSILYLFIEQRRNLENKQPAEILKNILQKQHEFYKNKQINLFYKDAIRGTTIEDIDIKEDFKIAESERKDIAIQRVIENLKSHGVSNNLINYIVMYIHQNGITQSGSNFFQQELYFELFFNFLYHDKQVRIEIISPTNIRIISPITYNACNEVNNVRDPVKYENNIRYEITSLVLEDIDPKDEKMNISNIKVTLEDCFYEITEPQVSRQLQTPILKKIILDMQNNVELENFDRNFLRPYILPSQKLNLNTLTNAPPGILVMLMLTDYSYAIDIMDNAAYKNKILNSEFNIYLYSVYEKHKQKYSFTKDTKNMALWLPIEEGKQLLDRLLQIAQEIENLSTEKNKDNPDNKHTIEVLQAQQKNISISSLSKKNMYDALRTYNVEDKIKLLAFPEIASALTADQLVEVLKSSIMLATVLLEPQTISQTVFSNHPINKLTEKHLLEILRTHPELWSIEGTAFGLKKSRIQGIPYRYKLSSDALLECVFSDDVNVRHASINAISNDPKLLSTLFSSNKLKMPIKDNEQQQLLHNILRLHLESPRSMQKNIENIALHNTYFKGLLTSNNPNDIKKLGQLAVPFMKILPIDNLLNRLNLLFNNNLATPQEVGKYMEVIKFHLAQENTQNNMIDALIHQPKLFSIFMHHNDQRSYQILFNRLTVELDKINTLNDEQKLNLTQHETTIILLENMFYSYFVDNFISQISNNDLFDLYQKIINLERLFGDIQKVKPSTTVQELLHKLDAFLSNQKLEAAIITRIDSWVIKAQYTNDEANSLASLYINNIAIREAIESHPDLLKKVIENADISTIIEMLNSNSKLVINIIQSFATNRQFRDNILLKSMINDQKRIESETLLSTILKLTNTEDLENFVKLIYVCKPHSDIDFGSLVRRNSFLQDKGNEYIDKIFNISSMSQAKQFLALPTDERTKLLNNDHEMSIILENASPDELDTIFSSHSSLLSIWKSKISIPLNHVSPKICESIIKCLSPVEIKTIYLYTDNCNKSIIISNKQILEYMLTDNTFLFELYIKDEAIRTIINNSTTYANSMLYHGKPGPVLFQIYMNASLEIKNKIVSDDALLNKMILMTSQNNLLALLKIQPDLSHKIISSIYEHYQTTEYMKWIVNIQPKLLNEMVSALRPEQIISLLMSRLTKDVLLAVANNNKLSQLNIDQLILLLNTKEPAITKAIIDSKECCATFLNAEKSKIQTVVNHEKIKKDMQRTLLPPAIQDEIAETVKNLQSNVTEKDLPSPIKKNGPLAPPSMGIKSS